MNEVKRGEVWLVSLDPTKGREQAGTRPCLVMSADGFNKTHLDLVLVFPITSKEKGFPTHVEIDPPEGGLTLKSYVKCEDLRSISKERLIKKLGKVTTKTMLSAERSTKFILGLS